jgi:hypothetical protein
VTPAAGGAAREPPCTAGLGRPADGAAGAAELKFEPGVEGVMVKFWPATTSCVPVHH